MVSVKRTATGGWSVRSDGGDLSRNSAKFHRMHEQHFRPLSDVRNIDKIERSSDWGPKIAAPMYNFLSACRKLNFQWKFNWALQDGNFILKKILKVQFPAGRHTGSVPGCRPIVVGEGKLTKYYNTKLIKFFNILFFIIFLMSLPISSTTLYKHII